ncbi:hypothetical protein E4634_19530 [Mangrovimicrobium sediminis]|uniref:Uncharacterized protein n=1 Tax=Mangrovimicrobium sediminis TaxID=2562682 RepID=A0A4Z0LUT5_9GAMM|nr:hypothetical protein [Haliea sp. SAOS-164]TGD71040.1 hypothetical protein E4634_19530 [Haliea sp. SAOS-164]
MRVIKTMQPADSGARRFHRRYGDQLCAVRYRESDCGSKLFTTIEIIVDERERPKKNISNVSLHACRRNEVVALRVAYEDVELRKKVKAAGAWWSRTGQAWVMRRDTAVQLGIAHRVQEGLVDLCTDIDTSLRF